MFSLLAFHEFYVIVSYALDMLFIFLMLLIILPTYTSPFHSFTFKIILYGNQENRIGKIELGK